MLWGDSTPNRAVRLAVSSGLFLRLPLVSFSLVFLKKKPSANACCKIDQPYSFSMLWSTLVILGQWRRPQSVSSHTVPPIFSIGKAASPVVYFLMRGRHSALAASVAPAPPALCSTIV